MRTISLNPPEVSDLPHPAGLTHRQNFALSLKLRDWLMLILTLVFVMLYAAALAGVLRPLTDLSMVLRLEPIIFVIIGYFFGRVPAQENESVLKKEIDRQIRRADAAQDVRERLEGSLEALEEKTRNARLILEEGVPRSRSEGNEENVTTPADINVIKIVKGILA